MASEEIKNFIGNIANQEPFNPVIEESERMSNGSPIPQNSEVIIREDNNYMWEKLQKNHAG